VADVIPLLRVLIPPWATHTAPQTPPAPRSEAMSVYPQTRFNAATTSRCAAPYTDRAIDLTCGDFWCEVHGKFIDLPLEKEPS
jgi:hypothetical protein